MTEILFYHLERHPLEKILPVLVEKKPRTRLESDDRGG